MFFFWFSTQSKWFCMLNRYLNNHLSSTLTVCWQGKPGVHLKEKLCVFLRPKCHPIFFDSNVNSEAVVRLNIYQIFLLCAMKFHCYIHDLSFICKLHKRYCSDIIQRSLRYGCSIRLLNWYLQCGFSLLIWLDFIIKKCYTYGLYRMIMYFFWILIHSMVNCQIYVLADKEKDAIHASRFWYQANS